MQTVLYGDIFVRLERRPRKGEGNLYAVVVGEQEGNGDFVLPIDTSKGRKVLDYEHLGGALDGYYRAIETIVVAFELGHVHEFGVDRTTEPALQLDMVGDGDTLNGCLVDLLNGQVERGEAGFWPYDS